MRQIVLALYAEGRTDDRFLPFLIQKTTRHILAQDEQNAVLLAVELIHILKENRSREACILEAAQQAAIYDALVVHSDADNRNYKQTKELLFDAGLKLTYSSHDHVCKNLLPIIPIRMVESWMLADFEALQKVLRTDLNARDLGLPEKAKQVEMVAKPKQVLEQAMLKAQTHRSRRHQQVDIGTLYEPIGEKISLERLSQVPSYKQFVADLTETLKLLDLL